MASNMSLLGSDMPCFALTGACTNVLQAQCMRAALFVPMTAMVCYWCAVCCPVHALQEPSRPIRFPTKIAANLQELSTSVAAVFSTLQQMLQEHVATATRQFRVQVSGRHWEISKLVPLRTLSMNVLCNGPSSGHH